MWCTARNLLVQDRILSSSNITAYKLLKNYTRGRYQYAVFVLNVLINYEYKTAHDPRMGCYWLQLSVKPPPHRPITPRRHQNNLPNINFEYHTTNNHAALQPYYITRHSRAYAYTPSKTNNSDRCAVPWAEAVTNWRRFSRYRKWKYGVSRGRLESLSPAVCVSATMSVAFEAHGQLCRQ